MREVYPQVPEALIALLRIVDGTYFREYQGEKITFFLLGSDVEEYPYYLLSAKQMVKNRTMAYDYYADYVNREFDPDEIEVIADSFEEYLQKLMDWEYDFINEDTMEFVRCFE